MVNPVHPWHGLPARPHAQRTNQFHLKLLQILQLFTSFMINQGYDNTIVTQNKLSVVTSKRIWSWEYLVTLKQITVGVLFANGNYI